MYLNGVSSKLLVLKTKKGYFPYFCGAVKTSLNLFVQIYSFIYKQWRICESWSLVASKFSQRVLFDSGSPSIFVYFFCFFEFYETHAPAPASNFLSRSRRHRTTTTSRKPSKVQTARPLFVVSSFLFLPVFCGFLPHDELGLIHVVEHSRHVPVPPISVCPSSKMLEYF